MSYLFTSESVSAGHPDRMCDIIANAILDEALRQDPSTHAGIEMLACQSSIIIGGEIKSSAVINYDDIVRKTLREIGFSSIESGINPDTVTIQVLVHQQSSDIAQGVEGLGLEEFKGKQGAGDQGIMFGYATDETESKMPAAFVIANDILRRCSIVRRNNPTLLFPDAKSQVTVLYSDEGVPLHIDTVVVSHHHAASVTLDKVRELIIPSIMNTLSDSGIDYKDVRIYINPTGRFVTGSIQADAGVVGRKIIADSYGGAGHHGGGTFNGKDMTKVDRSASYAARHAAKNVVAAGLAKRCEIQLAYAIGIPYPISIYVETFNTGIYSNEVIAEAVNRVFNFEPKNIADTLSMNPPKYKETSVFGHFGNPDFPWEFEDKIDELIKAVKEF